MTPHSIGSVLKIILGLGILWGLYSFVNVYEQPTLGLPVLFVAVFLITWGVSYFIFLRGYALFARPYTPAHSLKSYYLGIWFAIYIVINLSLMIFNRRSPPIGIILALGSIGTHVFITHMRPSKE